MTAFILFAAFSGWKVRTIALAEIMIVVIGWLHAYGANIAVNWSILTPTETELIRNLILYENNYRGFRQTRGRTELD